MMSRQKTIEKKERNQRSPQGKFSEDLVLVIYHQREGHGGCDGSCMILATHASKPDMITALYTGVPACRLGGRDIFHEPVGVLAFLLKH